jgi:hypothetical protein
MLAMPQDPVADLSGRPGRPRPNGFSVGVQSLNSVR